MGRVTSSGLWPLVRAERTALADALRRLPDESWTAPSLCPSWSVRDVVAHLTAGASTATLPWLANMAASRFDTDRHNLRLLLRHRGTDAKDTLARYLATLSSTTAPLGAQEGALGEVVVHAQDIALPLGLTLAPSRDALDAVAGFFARKDFAVNSRTLIQGLHLEATDGDFRTGDGPGVRGTTLPLVLAMAGRPAALDQLSGDGVAVLRERISPGC